MTTNKLIRATAFGLLSVSIWIAAPQIARAQFVAGSDYAISLSGADLSGGHEAGTSMVGYFATGATPTTITAGNYTTNDNGFVCSGTLTGSISEGTNSGKVLLNLTPITMGGGCGSFTAIFNYGNSFNGAGVSVSLLGIPVVNIALPQAEVIYLSSTSPTTLPLSGVLHFNDPSGSRANLKWFQPKKAKG